jgi:anthranilate/para-aminobenzoate synthase component II
LASQQVQGNTQRWHSKHTNSAVTTAQHFLSTTPHPQLAAASDGCSVLVCAAVQSGKPFFGICLGMQLLFEGSDESGGCEGLGLIKGKVSLRQCVVSSACRAGAGREGCQAGAQQ